jgi:hypothetical protein
MFVIHQILFLLFASLSEISFAQTHAARTTLPTNVVNRDTNSSLKQVRREKNHNYNNKIFISDRFSIQILL